MQVPKGNGFSKLVESCSIMMKQAKSRRSITWRRRDSLDSKCLKSIVRLFCGFFFMQIDKIFKCFSFVYYSQWRFQYWFGSRMRHSLQRLWDLSRSGQWILLRVRWRIFWKWSSLHRKRLAFHFVKLVKNLLCIWFKVNCCSVSVPWFLTSVLGTAIHLLYP